MAHFLEHLVFKGGQKYDDYRKVNETAERMGASLNAYTSHDLVAFHITSPRRGGARGDRPADRLRRAAEDRRRGAGPRARRRDPGDRARERPAVDGGRAPDRPRGVRRPPARPARARPRGAPAHVHARGDRRLPLAPVGRRRAAAPSWSATSPACPRTASWPRRSAASRRSRSNGGSEPAPAFTPQTLVEARESNQSHLRISYRPSIDPRDPAARAALGVYSTLLGGSMGSRLFDEIREQRGLAYSVYAVDHSFADVPILQLSAGLDSGKCVEAYTRMREIVDELRTDGPREEEFERAKAYAAGRRVLAFENTNAVARNAAAPGRGVRAEHRPRRGDRGARPDDVRRGRRGRSRHLRGGVGGVRRTARRRRVHRLAAAFRPPLCFPTRW